MPNSCTPTRAPATVAEVAATVVRTIDSVLYRGFRPEGTGGGAVVLAGETVDGLTVVLARPNLDAVPAWGDEETICNVYGPGDWTDEDGTGQHDALGNREGAYGIPLTPHRLSTLIAHALHDARAMLAARVTVDLLPQEVGQ